MAVFGICVASTSPRICSDQRLPLECTPAVVAAVQQLATVRRELIDLPGVAIRQRKRAAGCEARAREAACTCPISRLEAHRGRGRCHSGPHGGGHRRHECDSQMHWKAAIVLLLTLDLHM